MKLKIILGFVFLFFVIQVVNASYLVNYNFNTSMINDGSFVYEDAIRGEAVVLEIITSEETICKYSTHIGVPYAAMEGNFDYEFQNVHKEVLENLGEGVYKYYIKCKNTGGVLSKELEAIFYVELPVSAKITLSPESPLKAGRIDLDLVSSKYLSETPILSYSLDGSSYSPIALTGKGENWEGSFVVENSDGEKAGSFRFQGRDLEGIVGNEITKGGIFYLDTIKPQEVLFIEAEGSEDSIKLNWHYDYEYDKFNIYKSTSNGLDYTDLYKSTQGKSFIDNSVENGKTYYYKLSAVDQAGNEADLSREVYATVLSNGTQVTSNGLEARFLGLVDNLIVEINDVRDLADNIKNSFNSKPESEKQLYLDLKLSAALDSASNELKSLSNEATGYKSQSLIESELNKKLDSMRLKLNIIKKKIPENIIIIGDKSEVNSYSDNDLIKVLLDFRSGISENLVSQIVKKSLNTVKSSEFNVNMHAYNLEISYLDGARKEMSLIKEKISSGVGKNENVSIIERVPDSIASSAQKIFVKNTNYEFIQDKPIIVFSSDTDEIVYSFESKIDLNKVGEIKTILVYDISTESTSDGGLTGYFSFVDFNQGGYLFGIIIMAFIAAGAMVYLMYSRKIRVIAENVAPLKSDIRRIEEQLKKGEVKDAIRAYSLISEEYKLLTRNEKRMIFSELNGLNNKIKGVLKSEF